MTAPDSQKTIQKKVVVAACFGTFLEWYDFLTFASLAVYFSVLFFPPDDPVAALLASLGTFGVGMIVRPLGAALFGSPCCCCCACCRGSRSAARSAAPPSI